MRIAVWPVQPALDLGNALEQANAVDEVIVREPFQALAAVQSREVETALVPSLDVFKASEELEILPGIALAGERSPNQVLALVSPLDKLESISFDPRFGQEALLTQIVLKEHYASQPVFKPMDLSQSTEDRLAAGDAALLPSAEAPDGFTVLDLGREWLELTLRPMVWGLFVTLQNGVQPEHAAAIQQAVQDISPPESVREKGKLVYQFSLDGYAQAGLEEFSNHLYYHGALASIPKLPFIQLPESNGRGAEA